MTTSAQHKHGTLLSAPIADELPHILCNVPKGQLFVLTDSHSAEYCLQMLGLSIGDIPYHLLTIEAGEKSKTLSSVQVIWDFLFQHGATRQAMLINLGGGMITDLGGFAAATYMRGISFLNIPTTLLAMVDASSGGKTGINYQGVKNGIGTFTAPLATLIYPPFLQTLPPSEWLSGYAEMLKHGLIMNAKHWHELLAYDLLTTTPALPQLMILLNDTICIKQQIVEADFREQGLRRILNFGHTIGHAIEESYAEQGKHVPHGYCVMWGMVAELYLSVIKMGCPREALTQMSHLMIAAYGRPECNCRQIDALKQWMLKDKKNFVEQGTVEPQISFTLLRNIGDAVVNQTVTDDELDEALEYLFSL